MEKETRDEPCELCGKGVNRFGTRVDLEIFYEDYKYAGYPAFCSWEHAAVWSARPRPDFETWDRSPDADNEGFQYWGLIVVCLTLALSVYGLASLILTIV